MDVGEVAETVEKERKPQLMLIKGSTTKVEGSHSYERDDTFNGKRYLGPAQYQSRRIRQEWGCEESGFDWDQIKNGSEVHMSPNYREGPKIAENYFSFGFNTPVD